MALHIEELRKLCTDDAIIMTAHVIKRCNGEIIKQYEDDKPFPSCLLLGMSVNDRYLHVVASDTINLHIITAYYPNVDEWEPDFKTRKGR